jgi:hypothetical protein
MPGRSYSTHRESKANLMVITYIEVAAAIANGKGEKKKGARKKKTHDFLAGRVML